MKAQGLNNNHTDDADQLSRQNHQSHEHRQWPLEHNGDTNPRGQDDPKLQKVKVKNFVRRENKVRKKEHKGITETRTKR